MGRKSANECHCIGVTIYVVFQLSVCVCVRIRARVSEQINCCANNEMAKYKTRYFGAMPNKRHSSIHDPTMTTMTFRLSGILSVFSCWPFKCKSFLFFVLYDILCLSLFCHWVGSLTYPSPLSNFVHGAKSCL